MREFNALHVVRSTMREKGYTDSEINMVLGESAKFLLDRKETEEKEMLASRQRHRRRQALKEFESPPFSATEVEYVPVFGRPVVDNLRESTRYGRPVPDNGSFDSEEFE